MLNLYEVMETNRMIDHDLLDVRTITMGISLLDCADTDLQRTNEKIYAKILRFAGKLVETGEAICVRHRHERRGRRGERPSEDTDWRALVEGNTDTRRTHV